MAMLLAAGSIWLRPSRDALPELALRFTEVASESGCQNHHTMVKLSDRFANIMPWLSSVGAAVAAGDYDGDGFADLYVTNSGAGDPNRLYHNLKDGTFEEVAAQAGVDRPGGASMHSVWGDIDNDGDLDLYVTKWAATNTLYENRGGGVFADITERAGVGYWGYGNGATFLDFDRDGHLDLLVGNYFAAAVEDPATGKLVRNDLWNPVTTRVMHETFTHAANGGRNVLYRNRGDGTFIDLTDQAGLHFNGWTLAVGSADLDNDSWPDLYLANDFGPDELYFSTGALEDPPRFRPFIDGSGHPGIGADWWKGMNVDFGDVDGNGYFDIYVTNILAHKYKTDEGNMLWLNLADSQAPGRPSRRSFRNVAPESGVDEGGWGWGAVFADFDLDGLLDIFAVNGFVTGDPERTYWYQLQEMVTQTKNQAADAADWPPMGDRDLCGYERSRLFLQHPAPKPPDGAASGDVPQFVEVAERTGIDDLLNGRGVAVFDLENDGDLDIYVANQGAPSCLYRNELRGTDRGTPHWLGLELVGRPEQRWEGKTVITAIGGREMATTAGAVGARVELTANGRRQVRDVPGGRGFASQSSPRLIFGLGDGPVTLEQLDIFWPSARRQKLAGAELASLLDRTTRIVEPASFEGNPLSGAQ
jgi:hypothetical protein